MSHCHQGASPFGRTASIRCLLDRADAGKSPAQTIWTLALASQLIEEHLLELEACLARSRHAAQQARCRHVRAVWAGYAATIRARIEGTRQISPHGIAQERHS